jgi:hypothetical protein
MRYKRTQGGRNSALHHCAGNCNTLHCQQLFEMKLQPHTKHQQHDANFSKLVGHLAIGDKARRLRADDNTGDQVAHDRRQAEFMRDKAEHQSGAEAADECEYKVDIMHGNVYGIYIPMRSFARIILPIRLDSATGRYTHPYGCSHRRTHDLAAGARWSHGAIKTDRGDRCA